MNPDQAQNRKGGIEENWYVMDPMSKVKQLIFSTTVSEKDNISKEFEKPLKTDLAKRVPVMPFTIVFMVQKILSQIVIRILMYLKI